MANGNGVYYPPAPTFTDAQLKARPLDPNVRNTIIDWLARSWDIWKPNLYTDYASSVAYIQQMDDDLLVIDFKDFRDNPPAPGKNWSTPIPGVDPAHPGAILPQFTNPVKTLEEAFGTLTSADTWKRVAEFAIGAGLVFIAIKEMAK